MSIYKIVDRMGNLIGRNVVYYQSAGKYVSILNFLLLLATFKAAYSIDISAWIIVPVGFVVVMVVGIIDYRYIMKHQIAYTNEKNNLLKELRELRAIVEERK